MIGVLVTSCSMSQPCLHDTEKDGIRLGVQVTCLGGVVVVGEWLPWEQVLLWERLSVQEPVMAA